MPKLQLKKAALDPADGTPPYSSSQRPIRPVGGRGRPTIGLRRLFIRQISSYTAFQLNRN